MKAYDYNMIFTIEMPNRAVSNCSHVGPCDGDVDSWKDKIVRPKECTPAALRRELSEYGAWSDDELDDDDDNWLRIIWITAGNIKDGEGYTV